MILQFIFPVCRLLSYFFKKKIFSPFNFDFFSVLKSNVLDLLHFKFQLQKVKFWQNTLLTCKLLCGHVVVLEIHIIYHISVINLLDKTITEEQFQIRIYGASKVKKLAEKILKVTMKQTNEETEKSNVAQKDAFKAEHFQDLAQPSYSNRTNNMEHRLPNQYFIYSALGICFALLLFPHEDQPESTFRMLQVSVNLKLVVSLVSMLFFGSNVFIHSLFRLLTFLVL